jgi:hypothetical protein
VFAHVPFLLGLLAISPAASPRLDVPELISRLGSNEPVSWSAMDELARRGEVAVPALLDVLANRHPAPSAQARTLARNQTATTLGRMGPPAAAAAPALLACLEDDGEDESVRWAAAYALGSIGTKPREVVPALVRVLDRARARPSSLSGYAAVALADLARLHPRSHPALRRELRRLHEIHDAQDGDASLAAVFRILEPPSPSRLREEAAIAEAVLGDWIQRASADLCIMVEAGEAGPVRLSDPRVVRDVRQCPKRESLPEDAPLDPSSPRFVWLSVGQIDWLASDRVRTGTQACGGFDPCGATAYEVRLSEGHWVVASTRAFPGM